MKVKIPKSLQILLWTAAGISALTAISGTIWAGYGWFHNLEHQEKITNKNKTDIVNIQKVLERYRTDSIRVDSQLKELTKNQKLDSTFIYYNYYWVRRWNGH